MAGRRDFGSDPLLLCSSSEMISLERNLTNPFFQRNAFEHLLRTG